MTNLIKFALTLPLAFCTACGGDDSPEPNPCGTVHTVSTTDDFADPAYMEFLQANGQALASKNLTIAAGDCVNFEMTATHNAVEVSEESFNGRDGTPLPGGFLVQFGQSEQVRFAEAGTHYFVCQPHITGDMVATITVQ